VYLTDVRIPDAQRLGDVGKGWAVAITTLMNERVAIGGREVPRGGGVIAQALRLWRSRGHTDPVLRDRLARLWIEAEVLRLTNIRAMQAAVRGTPGPEGSVGKLFAAELTQRITELCVSLLGPEGMLFPEVREHGDGASAGGQIDIRKLFVRARANSIEGGTSEIMRNILGERMLGLPAEPRVDKDLAWNQVPR
jgi:alkylation response protein AidB-like acyl-CoA dehydrogenase